MEIGSEKWALLWDVRRSLRYHDRRRRFFEACHSAALVSGVVLVAVGYATSGGLIHAQWLVWFSSFAMLLFLVYLLFAFSRCASHHLSLKQKFGGLEQAIIRSDSENDVAEFAARRLEIEKDEPPIRKALDLLCHNELAKSQVETQHSIYKVTHFQRWTAQIFSWPNIQVELEQDDKISGTE